MKKIHILSLALIAGLALAITGCTPGRVVYAEPRPYSSVSLILSPGPGFVINRYADGRYYYRSPEGYTYWRGTDNRYYLDRTHISHVRYDQRQYSEWRGYDRRDHRRRR